MKPTSMIEKHPSLVHKKQHDSNFDIILECIKYSNNNREKLTLHKCVNNGTSAQLTSSGIAISVVH